MKDDPINPFALITMLKGRGWKYMLISPLHTFRLSHVIRLVPNVFWVIVEDAEHTSNLVTNLLMRSGLQDRSVQLSAKTPTNFKLQGKDPNWLKPRGVEQRNKALEWVRQHMADNGGRERHSVVYFMDDDNTYSTELFAEISKIERNKVRH